MKVIQRVSIVKCVGRYMKVSYKDIEANDFLMALIRCANEEIKVWKDGAFLCEVCGEKH